MGRIRIAVAEDDDVMRAWLVNALTVGETDVHQATSGAELVALLAEHGPFDLLVTDLSLPWMDGLQVIASARSAGVRTPVLFVTGHDHEGLAGLIARFGDSLLLRKPVGIAELRAGAQNLLARHPHP